MSTDTSKFSNVALGLAAAGPVLIGAFALLLVLRVPPVVAWFWPAPDTNVAEAAVLGDAARVRALAARGERLDVSITVRSEFREHDAPDTMSPLEAAIRLEGSTRREGDSIVEVLLDLGVMPAPEEARRLYCVASSVKAPEAAALLQRTFNVPAGSCN